MTSTAIPRCSSTKRTSNACGDNGENTFMKRYDVMEVIGSGVFSEVLKCVSRESGKSYACKRLNQKFGSFKELKNSAEVGSARMLPSHPNVLRLWEYYFNKLNGQVFLVFELMDGDLYALLRDSKELLPFSTTCSIMRQIFSGLAHIHKYKIFHCDLKPENVLLSLDREIVKIADFGCAKRMRDLLPYEGVYVATRWYRAPENILTNGFYGFKIDIWAVGCIFYEILSLRPLFPGVDEEDQLKRIHEVIGRPPPIVLQYFCKCNDDEKKLPPLTTDRGERAIRIGHVLSALRARTTNALDATEDWEESLAQENRLDSLLRQVITNGDSNYLDILSLLKNCLHYDPNWRPTAEEALRFSYFKSSNSL